MRIFLALFIGAWTLLGISWMGRKNFPVPPPRPVVNTIISKPAAASALEDGSHAHAPARTNGDEHSAATPNH